ncbi:Hypothetical predicted protein [Paramuricea clavata]|uniref:Uncharacterized protein n=1 Tax=Paramuricea clavata TaxID=317549 RepID=A0A6S7KMS5_PARCT|nr:Hypothetical predicted protein [Paramuricea clavata]
MAEELVHIEIYIKDDTNKTGKKIAYECVDNDKNILFSPYIFPDCIGEWAADSDVITECSVNTLRHRLNVFQTAVAVPPDVTSKIENIIKFIKKPKDIYVGIRAIY